MKQIHKLVSHRQQAKNALEETNIRGLLLNETQIEDLQENKQMLHQVSHEFIKASAKYLVQEITLVVYE